MKDYYAVLGVSPDAELEVISAAYKALARKYHPDTNPDSDRMQLINEAYDVLSTPDKKRAYDQKIKQRSAKNKYGDYGSEGDNEGAEKQSIDGDRTWALIVEHYPHVENNRLKLQELSASLGQTYKSTIINEKAAHRANEIAQDMERKYLARYFGSSVELQQLAKDLILKKDKNRALKINQLVKSLGEGSSSLIKEKILTDIQQEAQREETIRRREEIKRATFTFNERDIKKREQEKIKREERSQMEDKDVVYFWLIVLGIFSVIIAHLISQ